MRMCASRYAERQIDLALSIDEYAGVTSGPPIPKAAERKACDFEIQ